MINKFKLIILAIIIGFMFSCEQDPMLFPEDAAYVAFSKSNLAFLENDTTLNVELYLVTSSKERIECTITANSEGIENPAIEGIDYNFTSTIVFENGVGYANATLSLIDNELSDGKKQFFLEITSASNGIDLGIDGKEKILITITDDEHPLTYFNGEYTHVGNSPSTWSGTVSWTTQISINPDNDSQIIFTNIFPWSQNVQIGVIGTVNELEKTIVLASAQKLSETGEGNYYFRLYSAENINDNWEGDATTDPILGTYTINPEKTDIVITLNEWGAKWIEPDGNFDGRWFNDYFYTSTLTKNTK